jgi:hypothetical protein
MDSSQVTSSALRTCTFHSSLLPSDIVPSRIFMFEKLLAFVVRRLASKNNVGPLSEGPRSPRDPAWGRLAECLGKKFYVEKEERRQLDSAAQALVLMSVVWWCVCLATGRADSSSSASTMFFCSVVLLFLLGLTKPGYQVRVAMIRKARDDCRRIAENQQPIVLAPTLDLVFKQSVVLLRLPQRMCHEF